jgi:hypothetical protein
MPWREGAHSSGPGDRLVAAGSGTCSPTSSRSSRSGSKRPTRTPLRTQRGPSPLLAPLGTAKEQVGDLLLLVEVGRLELRPSSRSVACSRPYPAVDLWFLATRRDRWCPLRSAGCRSGVYPACTGREALVVSGIAPASSACWDKPAVCLFLHGNPRCNVPREDCGPRREGAAAPPVGQGASSQEVAAAAAPSPVAGRTPARRAQHVAWHATLAAWHRWRGGSPCQPPPAAPPSA